MIRTKEGIRVLLVDDDAKFGEFAASCLEQEDERFDIETKTSASTGLDRLSGNQFDCVVSDYDMPNINGIDFLQSVREEHPKIPFILYTGKGSEDAASRAISIGVTDYFRKEGRGDQFTILANRIANSVDKFHTEREAERVKAFIEHTSDIIFVVDPSGLVSYINSSVEDVLGYTPEELEGTSGFDIIHPDDLEDAQQEFGQVLNDPEYLGSVTCRVSHTNGSYRTLEIRARNLIDNPDVGGVVVTARDTTEKERREEQLEQVTSILSHDLRNPLNVAQGRLELAIEECECDHLEPIDRAHERMENLITDMLKMAQEDMAVGDTSRIDLAALAIDSWKNVETADARFVAETDRTVRADEGRLKQVFENLFRNAVEHGGETVTVTLGEMDGGFYIEDDGAGIPTEDFEDIFDPGYSHSDSGTGLGLSIVKMFINAHDWSIRATSGSDGGTRFEITGVQFPAE